MTTINEPDTIHLRPFQPADQAAVRALILAGLAARFGFLDESLNPDVDDIQRCYIEAGATVLVAEQGGVLIGCGALIPEEGSASVGRLVRVSVAAEQQGRGLGRRISQALIEAARARGFTRLLVETNHDWTSALRLYQSLGFVETHRVPVPDYGYTELHMAQDMTGEPPR
jgi:GNAT superfamily N-acetyltransferase